MQFCRAYGNCYSQRPCKHRAFFVIDTGGGKVKKRVALNFKLFFKSPLLVLGFAAAMITPHIMMWERAGRIFAGSDNGVYGLANYMLLYSAVPFLLTALLTYEFVKKAWTPACGRALKA